MEDQLLVRGLAGGKGGQWWWWDLAVDHLLGLLVVDGGAQRCMEWASEGVEVVGVPVGLMVKAGWGLGPGVVRVGLHKGVEWPWKVGVCRHV